MEEICQRCSDKDYDHRTLWMACFYEMNELGLPFKQVKVEDLLFYTLRVCKKCRAEWMGAIQSWFNKVPKKEKSCGSGIFVRRNGAILEISEEEWYRNNPGRKLVKFKYEDKE